MENLYLYMIIALALLAAADLVVGVSNDAVNFLNSAIGSKALSFKTIMITASIGIAIGAIFSSGLMEVARKGIFNPGEFFFNEIIIIFMAVMITDILLLDFFNTVGMPTSTTVSIVFELLGASVAMSLIKMGQDDSSISELGNYINTTKASQIIMGILLSVAIAFTIGALIQYVVRMLLSFNFQNKAKWTSALFGGFAASAITYFILIKGLKGVSFVSEDILNYIQDNTTVIVVYLIAFWLLISLIFVYAFRVNVYKFIILIGTFGLALSFAGNDLVNFIGVPIAAWQSYEAWVTSGIAASDFSMEVLAAKVSTPTLFLGLAGVIMILTLWFSKKSRSVTETEINLARQGEGNERFQPNYLSRSIVRLAVEISRGYNYLLPENLRYTIERQFNKPTLILSQKEANEQPSFDMVRASVNLMVASVLISIATSMKLPLSTTYVTFMVAMGTSLADRAWGSESAVYRVAGVLNVIGGWFFTAFVAFSAAALIAYLIHLNVPVVVSILLLIAAFLIGRNYLIHRKTLKAGLEEDRLIKAESSSIQGVIHESAKNIANVVKRGIKIYSNSIAGLSKQDLTLLNKNRKQVAKLSKEVEDLRDNIFYFIKNLDEPSVSASNFYINILRYLQDMTQCLEYISKITHKHINNNHKKLKFNQVKELKQVNDNIEILFSDIKQIFETESFEKISNIVQEKAVAYEFVKQKIQLQVERTRKEESSPKNTTLYFSILLETKDLINSTMNLLEEYHESYDTNVIPATIDNKEEESAE